MALFAALREISFAQPFYRTKTPAKQIRNPNIEIRNKLEELNPNYKIRNGLVVTIRSIRIEIPRAARLGGAIERERHSLALRPPIADSFNPQPQERKQLCQIHQAFCFLSLRQG